MAADRMLEEHGTKLMQLKPSSIIHAAEADIKLRARKVADAESENPDDELRAMRYAFRSEHVRRAKDARQLLELALKAPAKAANSSKKATRLIYGDADLLRAAIEVAP